MSTGSKTTVLQEKIAGMRPQAAEKLARELQEFVETHTHPEVSVDDFPLLAWLYKAIKLEGTIAEQVHLCPQCAKDNHVGHTLNYEDHDGNPWKCKCPRHW